MTSKTIAQTGTDSSAGKFGPAVVKSRGSEVEFIGVLSRSPKGGVHV